MKPAADKVLIYTVVVILCVIVIWTIVFAIPAALFGVSMM